jgi:hypothetical protein
LKKLIGMALVASLAAGAPIAGATQPNPNKPNKPYKVPPGQYCKDQNLSKKHIEGQKGTPFSQCVSAMAKLGKQQSLTPGQACASLKKGKGKSAKRAAKKAFKQCVAAGNELRDANVSS